MGICYRSKYPYIVANPHLNLPFSLSFSLSFFLVLVFLFPVCLVCLVSLPRAVFFYFIFTFYVFVCYPYVARMYSYVTRMLPVGTRMYSYVIGVYLYVIVCYSVKQHFLLAPAT